MILLAALAIAQVDLFPFEGRPIVSIDISGPEGENLELVRSLLDIQPGYLFATPDLSRGVRRIYALGRFRDVSVSVVPVGVVVSLLVEVKTQAIAGELIFSGDVDDEVVREMRGVLPAQQPLDENLMTQLEKRVEKTWESFGYPKAQCRVTKVPSKRQRVDLEIACQKGPGSYVLQLEFVGHPKARDYQLDKEITLVPGVLFAERKLKVDDRTLRTAYFKRGFLQMQVKLDVAKKPNGVDLRYTIEAGPRIVLKVAGNRAFGDTELTSMLKREADEPLTATLLDSWRRTVVERYLQKGFAYAKAEIKTYTDPGRDIAYHVLFIDEGKRYYIDALTFPGATHFPEGRLRDEVIAFVNQRLDASLFTGELNPSAVRALEDSGVGIKSPPRVRKPAHDHWFYRIDPDRVYEPEAYNQAEDAIRRLYLEQGFTRVEVGPLAVERREEESKLAITMPVREGPRAMVSTLIFSGSNAIEVTQMLDLAKLQADQPFSELAVEETRNAVQKSLASKGYLYARVEPTVDFDPTLTQANVRFSVSDGPQVMVSRVLVQGNDETNEMVIRDRVLLEADKPYSPDMAQTTKAELQRLEVFDSTTVGLADPEVPAEQKDVLIRLAERKTLIVDFGLGVSTAQGVRGFFEVTEKNLFGRAQQLTFRVQLNRQLFFSPIFYGRYAESMDDRFRNDFTFENGRFSPRRFFLESIEHMVRLSWRTPRSLKLPGRPQIYSEAATERLNTLAFSLNSGTFLVGVDLNPAPQLRAVLETGVALNALKCFTIAGATTTNTCDVRNFGRAAFAPEGTFLNWKSGPTIYLDFRDNPLNPRSGFLGVLKTDLVVGRQLDRSDLTVDPGYSFLKAEGALTGYIPVGKTSSFAISGRIGNIFRIAGDESLLRKQLNELYFLGGRNTLRGYFEQSVLPQDACVVRSTDSPKRCSRPENRIVYDSDPPPISPGAFFYLLKGEFRFPIYSDIMGSIFVDAGNLYFQASAFEPALLWNIGAGVRYQTPVGALAFDLGVNPVPRADRGEVVVAYPYIYVGLF